MIFNLYCIKDELAGTFANLMVVNEKVAQRTFKWLMEENEPADCDDKRIYLMGTYDNETGAINPCVPQLVYNLEEEKKHAGKNL